MDVSDKLSLGPSDAPVLATLVPLEQTSDK
jgi:hypothetical protein